MRYLLSLFVFLYCSATSVFAQSNALFEVAEETLEQNQNFEESALRSSDWAIYQNFRTALLDLKQDDYAALAESLEQLKFVSVSRGYTDLPDYSLELLRHATVQKDPFKAKFLVEKAVFLSPADSRVSFSASSMYKIIGLKKSFGLLFNALINITDQPIFLATILLNIVIVLLVSLTIAVFFSYFIQILRNSSLIRESLFPFIPWKSRGVVSIIVLAGIYFAPFLGGILVVLAVWGICLGSVLGRRYIFIAGILCMLWGWFLPMISKVAYNVNDPSSRVFEDLNLSRFSPKAEQYLQNRLAENPNDGTSLFFLGQSFRLKGFSDSAATLLTRVDEIGGVDRKLKQVSRANLGVIAFDNGEYTKALELLEDAEKQGLKGFEIYYNLAIANLVLIKTDEYTKYYNLAKAIAPKRISQIVTDKYLSPKAILIPVSSDVMLKPLFNPIATFDKIESVSIEAKYQKVSSILSGGLSSNITLVLGFLLCLVCFGYKFKKSPVHGVSKVWIFFPFGRYLASNNVIMGVVGLTLLVGILMLAPSGPFDLYATYASFENLYGVLLLIVLSFLSLVQALSFYTVDGAPNER